MVISMQPHRPSPGFWHLLSPDEQRVLRSVAQPRQYRPGTNLCVEGDQATHVFILRQGWVKVISVSVDGHQHVGGLRGAGDIVGEMAGETTGRRNATVQAIVPVHALTVGYDRFSAFLDAHQGGSRAYGHVMARRWLDAETMIALRAVTTGAQRLAGLLLTLAERLDGQPEGVVEIALPLSQDELASLAGTSRATVTRALRGWRERGLLRTGSRRITLTDLPGLSRTAGPAGGSAFGGAAS